MKRKNFVSKLALGALLAASLFLSSSCSAVKAENRPGTEVSAAELLPPTTILFAEMSHPRQLVDLILSHPLREKVESFDKIGTALKSPGFAQFQMIVGVIEGQIGMTWKEAIEATTTGGFYLAFDPASNGVAVLTRARDRKTLEMLRDTFIRLARDDAKNKGKSDPIETTEYRGITAYGMKDVRFATLDTWLIWTNKAALGKTILDNYADEGGTSLADSDRFQQARKSIVGKPTLWAYLDIGTLRDAGAAPGLMKKTTENPVAELLFGGLLETVQNTPYLAGSLYLTEKNVELKVAAPHDAAWISEARQYYFGVNGNGAAPPLLRPQQNLISLSTHRDLSAMWVHAPDLYGEKIEANMAKANTNLSTLFGGKDFSEEILGAVQPDMQIVATRQAFAEGPVPAIKLPAVAAVFRFKDAETMRVEFRRLFQSLIGFVNVAGASKGQPQFDLDVERNGERQVITATYLPEKDEKDSKQARINFNISPSVAFVKDCFILSSTKELARELAELAENPARRSESDEAKGSANTQVAVDLTTVHQSLDDNRQHLIAQNMLKEGNDRDEAETKIGMLLDILTMFQSLDLQLSTGDKMVELGLNVNLAK